MFLFEMFREIHHDDPLTCAAKFYGGTLVIMFLCRSKRES